MKRYKVYCDGELKVDTVDFDVALVTEDICDSLGYKDVKIIVEEK